jgi:hypothetical protein
MKRFLVVVGASTLAVSLVFAGYVAYRLKPKELSLPLPDSLIAIDSIEGQALLTSSGHLADYPSLTEFWEAQELVSYCGVASGVIILKAAHSSARFLHILRPLSTCPEFSHSLTT